AEDGIRDFHVTGVQTCALPISCCGIRTGRLYTRTCRPPVSTVCHYHCRISGHLRLRGPIAYTGFVFYAAETYNSKKRLQRPEPRSEERRVGKECRIRR